MKKVNDACFPLRWFMRRHAGIHPKDLARYLFWYNDLENPVRERSIHRWVRHYKPMMSHHRFRSEQLINCSLGRG